MDNYALLLEQFHVYQHQKYQSKQFIEIIDQLRVQKQSKQLLLHRKKQEHSKLSQQTLQSKQLNKFQNLQYSVSNISRCTNTDKNTKIENQIKNSQLKKQINDLQKSIMAAKTSISQIQSQLNVFSKKDNEIKQLYYTSKRNLQEVKNQLKFERQMLQEIQTKNIKVLENLHAHKKNLQHELRYLADDYWKQKAKLKEKSMMNFLNGALQLCLDGQNPRKRSSDAHKSFIQQENSVQKLKNTSKNRSSRTNILSNCHKQNYDNRLQNQFKKRLQIKEIYTKRYFQQLLNVLFTIKKLHQLWQVQKSEITEQKIYKQYKSIIQNKQFKEQQNYRFRFMSKNQIYGYYINNGITLNSQFFIEFYNILSYSIDRQQKVSNQLNQSITNLKIELNILQQIFENILQSKDKSAEIYLTNFQTQLENKNTKTQKVCKQIFSMIFIEYWVIDKIQRVYLYIGQYKFNQNCSNHKNLTFLKDKLSNCNRNMSNTFDKLIKQLSENRKLTCIGSEQNINNKPSRKNSLVHHSLFPQIKQFIECLSKWDMLTPQQIAKSIPNSNNIQNLQEWVCKKINQNTIFKLFYHINKNKNPKSTSKVNEQKLSRFNSINNTTDISNLLDYFQINTNLYFQSLNKLIRAFKQMFMHIYNLTLKQEQQIQKQIKNSSNNKLYEYNTIINNQNTPNYTVQSKEYYRRDNFKLLQKLQRIELKKKGLYIPFRFGLDIEKQLLQGKKIEVNKENIQKNINSSSKTPKQRDFKLSMIPNTPNYVSDYRQRINKADKKIRQLLNTAQQMKMHANRPLKSSRASSYNKFRLSTRSGIRTQRNSLPLKKQ